MTSYFGFVILDSNTWIFDEGGVRFFLLAGNEKAILVDTHTKSG